MIKVSKMNCEISKENFNNAIPFKSNSENILKVGKRYLNLVPILKSLHISIYLFRFNKKQITCTEKQFHI